MSTIPVWDSPDMADYITHLPECSAYSNPSNPCDCGAREIARGLRGGTLRIVPIEMTTGESTEVIP